MNAWIFAQLDRYIPRSEWRNLRFIDAFMGGGAVSLQAKRYGFKQILANDVAFRSQIVAEAFLMNNTMSLTREDVLGMIRPLSSVMVTGFVESQYTPHVFSTRHAEALDALLFWAYQSHSPTKRALKLCLLWHMIGEFVCFPTSIGTSNRPFAGALDGIHPWESLNPKRFVDGSLERMLVPCWTTLEALNHISIHTILPDTRSANACSKEVLDKLERNIARTGYYPPLIVRPDPQTEWHYILLDGHHRLKVLHRLGWESVDCQIWSVSDEEARIALLTLNRLRGEDDPIKRAELLFSLT